MVFSVAQSSLALNSVMAVGALTGMGLLRELSTLLAQPVSDEAVDSFRQDLASHAPQIRAAQDAGILTGSMRRLLGVIEEGETLSATERGEMAQAFTGALTLLGQVPLRKSFRAELERPVSQVLWDSEASFQKIFEEGPLGMSIVGRRLDFHAANAQLIQLLGYDVETLKTKTALDIIHPDFHREFSRLNLQVFSGEIPHFTMVGQFICRDGTIIWGRLTATVICDSAGRPLYGLGMFEDVSHEKELEHASIQAARLRERLAAFRFIHRSLAHDINNAMGAVLGALDLIRVSSISEEAREMVGIAEVGAEQIAPLVRTIQDLASEARPGSPFDINSELTEEKMVATLRSMGTVTLRLDPEPWFVPGPRENIARVIQNMVSNARDAMVSEEVQSLTVTTEKVTIDVRTLKGDTSLYRWGAKPGDYMRISFQDTGHGISPEAIQRIFELGFSTKERSGVDADKSHQGLGLALVQKFVHEAGGFITVHSTLGQGTRFDIYLPRVEQEEE